MAKFTDEEIIRGGSDVSGGKDSLLKGRAKTKDGKKLWTSEDGFHYETKEEMLKANKEFREKTKSIGNSIFESTLKNLTRQGEELQQKNEAMTSAIKEAEDSGKEVTTDPVTGEVLADGKVIETPSKSEKKETSSPVAEVVEQKEEKKTVKEEPKVEETPKAEEPKEEVKEDPSSEAKQADENTVEKIAQGKGTVAEYLASEHPSTVGYIANRIKNGDIGEALRVSLKAVGSVLGGALFANGMSLLGDNSHFANIGAGTSLKNMTSEEQQKVADAIVDVQAAQAQDTIANKKIVDKWLPNLDENKKALISGSGFAIATLDNEKLSTLLSEQGFTADEIKNVINVKPMLKYSSAQAIENVSKIAGTKTTETAEKKAAYDFTVEQFNNENAIRQKITELENQKRQITIQNKQELVELASNIAGFYGTATKAENQSKNFGWNASADVSVKFVAKVAGGVQGANSSGESSSVSGFTDEGREKALQAVNSMNETQLKEFTDNLVKSYDDAIKGLKEQLKYLETHRVNDAVIPNGSIDAVLLKDGTEIEVNSNDGAVLTTNPVSKALLTFDEGELNPFEYLGYDGDKKECEYYDTIFDDVKKEIKTFDDALSLLD